MKVWILLLILILGAMAAVTLSGLAVYRAKGGQDMGLASTAALQIAEFPGKAWQLLTGELKTDNHEMDDRFPDEPAGFNVVGDPVADPQFLLLSRYDGNIGASVVELVREDELEIVHRWVFDDAQALDFDSDAPFIERPQARLTNTLRTVHPWLSEDGSLFVKIHFGAMYRIGSCGDVEWVNSDFMYHHSLERDPSGNFWTVGSSTTDLDKPGFDDRFRDNRAILLSPDGDVIYDRSILEILIDNGLFNRINDYDRYQTDPLHLNDVQPVFEDAEIARRGDVYLSVSHLNMLLLYRPESDELIWWTQDYMMQQHDVDIIGPDAVQLFDNRKWTGADGSTTVSPNEMLRFQLPSREGTPTFVEPMRMMDVRTKNQGLADMIAGSGIVMEDTNAGRLVKLSESGVPEWTYLNRSDDGRVWTLNWSRYIPSEIAEPALEQLGKSQCLN